MRLEAFVGLLVLLAGGALAMAAPASEDNPGEQLSRSARALRRDGSADNYRRLERFVEEFKESELSAQAAFALGQADRKQKRWGDARHWFRIARSSQWLADYAVFYEAEAEGELGLLEMALRALEEFSFAGTTLEESAAVLRADLLVRAGRPHEAVEWLNQQPELASRPALLLALGKAQRDVAAAETLMRVYYEFPLSPEAEPANALVAELRAELKAQFPSPSEALRRTRAEKLWALGAYRGARSAYVDLSVRSSEPTRSEARVRAAIALYELGTPDAACQELSKIGPDSVGALVAEFHSSRARCALRARDYVAADAELAFLASTFPTSDWYRRGVMAAGNTANVEGDIGRAQAYFRRISDIWLAGNDAAEAHWKLAWLTYRAGETAAATTLIEEHLERFPDSPFLARALFWRARLALAAGERGLAERLLTLLREWAPRDYFTQQAERLDKRAAGAPAGSDAALPEWASKLSLGRERPERSELPAALHSAAEKAAALERLALWELADEELESAARQSPHPDLAVARARLALVQEKYARATELLNDAFPAYWRYELEEMPRDAWEMMFPRPYWQVIQREARRQQLDPYLVAALIRQESRFEADALSSSGAYGLMQLMPGTARQLARRRALPESRLYEPELNIQLGTRFLAQLLARFGGSVEKALAAYNAGGTRVEEWGTRSATTDPAEFVESIPVGQTREFVYVVMRNYRFYRDLYAPR
ncbi:MAG: transglycosylase SLT domain-containing protein [Candidatus Acidiferrales bacterium]